MFTTSYNASKKLWSGTPTPLLHNSKLSVGHELLRAMKRAPQKIAQINTDSDIEITFEEMYLKSVRAAQNIKKLGCKEGEVIPLIAHNNHDVAPICMALLCIGNPFYAMYPVIEETDFLQLLQITKSKVIFCEMESYAMVKKCVKQLDIDAKIYTFCGQIDDSIPVEELFAKTGVENEFVPAEVDGENDVAVILQTSGTTNKSKGVCLTHAMLWTRIEQYFEPMNRADTVLLYFTQVCFITGINFILSGAIYNFTRVISANNFSPSQALHAIEKYKVSIVLMRPTRLISIFKCKEIATTDLSSLKFLLAGGERIPQFIWNEFPRYFPNSQLSISYGMTELGSIARNHPYAGVKATGQLHCDAKVKIIDKNGDRMDVGEIGEICVKKTFKFVGYYENPEKSLQSFDDEGFMLTGDAGYFDENGYLYVIDRMETYWKTHKNDIVHDLTEFLLSHPMIRLAYVAIVTDSVLVAVVVRNENSQITEADLFGMVSKNFNGKQPLNGGIHFVDSLKLNRSGKIVRREMQVLAENLYGCR